MTLTSFQKSFMARYFIALPIILYAIWENLETPTELTWHLVHFLNSTSQAIVEVSLLLLSVEFTSLPGAIITPTSVGVFIAGCSSYLAYFTLAGLILVTADLTLKTRLKVFFQGAAFIFLVNNLRILGLFSISLQSFTASEAVHDFLWRWVMGPMVLIAWVYLVKIERGQDWKTFLKTPLTDLEVLVKNAFSKKKKGKK